MQASGIFFQSAAKNAPPGGNSIPKSKSDRRVFKGKKDGKKRYRKNSYVFDETVLVQQYGKKTTVRVVDPITAESIKNRKNLIVGTMEDVKRVRHIASRGVMKESFSAEARRLGFPSSVNGMGKGAANLANNLSHTDTSELKNSNASVTLTNDAQRVDIAASIAIANASVKAANRIKFLVNNNIRKLKEYSA